MPSASSGTVVPFFVVIVPLRRFIFCDVVRPNDRGQARRAQGYRYETKPSSRHCLEQRVRLLFDNNRSRQDGSERNLAASILGTSIRSKPHPAVGSGASRKVEVFCRKLIHVSFF